jgi:hypothetical protein
MSLGLRNAAQTFQCFMDKTLKYLDFCFAYLVDILVFSLSPKSTIIASVHSSVTSNLRYPNQPSDMRFPCSRNFIPGIQNHIPEFPAPPGMSRRSPSLSSSQERQPTSTFLGNDKFVWPFFPHAASIQVRLYDVLSGLKVSGSHLSTWTSCKPTPQHAIHPRAHSSTGTSGTRPTCPTPGHHTTGLGTTIVRRVQSRRSHRKNISDCLGRPAGHCYQHTGSNMRKYWKGLNTKPAAYQPSPAVHQ